MGIRTFIILMILLISSIQDLSKREVSNLASLFLFLIGLINIDLNKLIAFLIITTTFLILYFKDRKIGAGDVKIISALSINIGLFKSINALIIAVFIEALMIIITKKETQPMIPYIFIGYIMILIIL